MLPKKKRILFLCPYPLEKVGSQRFRFEQYFEQLETNGIHYTVKSFFSNWSWSLFKKGSSIEKGIGLTAGFIQRLLHLFLVPSNDFIFVHREATPIGPPFIEWTISKLLRKRIIYDFDDAIWMTDNLAEPIIQKLLKWRRKVKQICKWSYKVSAGNSYLASYAQQLNKNVTVLPTTIDTENLHNASLYPDKEELKMKSGISGPTIIWTGSHSTLKYLEDLRDVLLQLEKEYSSITFIVIADEQPKLPLKNLIFKKWSPQTEISDLLLADIGIMPLPNDEWTKGKCGFKALQYMSLEIPTVASPVGVNTSIITNYHNGILCESRKEWLDALRQLISEPALRSKIGKNGRLTVVQKYSKESNTSVFLSLFQ